MNNLDYPRAVARAAIERSVPPELWEQSNAFVTELRREIKEQVLADHPVLSALRSQRFGAAEMRTLLIEYRPLVHIFTDCLLAAQFLTRQMEPRLPPGSKIHARFLLTLNVLDELGFSPGLDCESYYRGNPAHSHYCLYEAMLDQIDIGAAERAVPPSRAMQAVLDEYEGAMGDLVALSTLLAVNEDVVVKVSRPLGIATGVFGVDVLSQGYFHVHGSSQDPDSAAADDSHEDDLWYVLMQALTPERYDEARARARRFASLIEAFWSNVWQRFTSGMADLAGLGACP